MSTVVIPAPAKLNLSLRVTGKRSDGYHLLDSLMVLLDYGDIVQVTCVDTGSITTEPYFSASREDDLCYRAATLLRTETGCHFGAAIQVEKRIPMGGGLGGGSSDAAAVLLALNHLWQLGLTRTQLRRLGMRLGADVPFFLFGEPALASGIGEILRAVSVPNYWYLVLSPPVEVKTAAIFADLALTLYGESRTIPALCEGGGGNDLQACSLARYPIIGDYLAWLHTHAAPNWIGMTGSGACVFAALTERAAADELLARLPASMSGFVARGIPRHPALHLAVN